MLIMNEQSVEKAGELTTFPSSTDNKNSLKSASKHLMQGTGLIVAATLVSRVLGFLRDQLAAIFFGASVEIYGDANNTAFRISNLLRDLFAEGALSTAFQPFFTKIWQQDGPAAAYQFANRVIGVLLLILLPIVAAGMFFAPSLVLVMAPGFAQMPEKVRLTVQLVQIMMPFLLLVSMAAVMMAMLNAQQKFLWPALAPAMFNLVIVLFGITLKVLHVSSRISIYIWAAATLLGGICQLLVQVPPLWRAGYRFAFTFKNDPRIRQLLVTMAPVIIGLMAMQANVFIGTIFASKHQGAVSWLNSAFRLQQLPIGLFGVAIGTVALGRYSMSALDGPEGMIEIQHTLQRALQMVFFLVLPATVGLVLLAQPLIRLLFQHGAFNATDTHCTALALQYYSIGLLGYSAVKVIAPLFYALRRTFIPVAATLIAVLTSILTNIVLYPTLGYKAVALGVSLAGLVNVTFLLAIFHCYYGKVGNKTFWMNLLKIMLAAGIMALLVKGLLWSSVQLWGQQIYVKARYASLLMGLIVAAGAVVYFLLCQLLRLEEASALVNRLKRILFKR